MHKPGRSNCSNPNGLAINRASEAGKLQLKLQKASQSSPIQEDIKNKTNDQLTSNSDTPTDSGELPKSKPRYVRGATEILNSKDPHPEDIFDYCLTDPEDPEETILELSRPNRSPHPE